MKKVPFNPLEPTQSKMIVFSFCSLEQTKHEIPSQPMSFSWRNIRDEVAFHRHFSLQ